MAGRKAQAREKAQQESESLPIPDITALPDPTATPKVAVMVLVGEDFDVKLEGFTPYEAPTILRAAAAKIERQAIEGLNSP